MSPGFAHRNNLFNADPERVMQLVARATEKTVQALEPYCVILVDVDDPMWRELVDILMPDHDWDAIRATGAVPIARGVVPFDPIKALLNRLLGNQPETIGVIDDREDVQIIVLGAGGATTFVLDTEKLPS